MYFTFPVGITIIAISHYLVLAEADDVHVDLLLLELLGDLDERGLVRVEGRPHEQDDASLVVLVLAVLQGQLQIR